MDKRSDKAFNRWPVIDDKSTQDRSGNTTDDPRYDVLLKCLFGILGTLRAVVFFEGLILGVVFVKLVL